MIGCYARTDSSLESEIDAAYERMMHSDTDALSRLHFNAMVCLIRQRSAEQIAKMEFERRIGAKYAPLVTYQIGDVM
jgi:hypothetical protein